MGCPGTSISAGGRALQAPLRLPLLGVFEDHPEAGVAGTERVGRVSKRCGQRAGPELGSGRERSARELGLPARRGVSAQA